VLQLQPYLPNRPWCSPDTVAAETSVFPRGDNGDHL
jgi:hypothetical protein